MNKTVKLTIATFVVALTTTIGMAAPADAKPADNQRIYDCC